LTSLFGIEVGKPTEHWTMRWRRILPRAVAACATLPVHVQKEIGALAEAGRKPLVSSAMP
jgi:hypothetical protein